MSGKAVAVVAAVIGVGAALWWMKKRKPEAAAVAAPSKGTPPRPRPLAVVARAVKAFATAPAPTTAVDDYHGRYTAWLNTLDPGLKSQAPPILPNYLLQGKTPAQVNAYMTDHAARVKAWWGEVSKAGSAQAAITTAPTTAATARDAFAELDRLVDTDLKRQQQIPGSAAATINQATVVQMAAEALQRWYDSIPEGLRRQAPAPLRYVTYGGTAYTQVRADYGRAQLWRAQLGQTWQYMVPQVPMLPLGMPG